MKTKVRYNIACEKCGKERSVGYNMNWLLQKNLCNNFCMSCGKKGIPRPNARGRILSKEHRAKIGASWKGRKHTESTRLKMSLAQKGKLRPYLRTPEAREKIRIAISGRNNYQWLEDRSKLKRTSKQGERRSSAYIEWRKQVWLRDNFKCKIANPDCLGKIEAHHILGWTEYVELRYEINNGITLCHAHHPRKRAEEKRLTPYFQDLVSASKV